MPDSQYGTSRPTGGIDEAVVSAQISKVQEDYLQAGAAVAGAISDLMDGVPKNLAPLVQDFVEAEKRYAALGFRPFSLTTFLRDSELWYTVGQRLREGENPTFYAQRLEEQLRNYRLIP